MSIIFDKVNQCQVAELCDYINNNPQSIYDADMEGYIYIHWASYLDKIDIFATLINMDVSVLSYRTFRGQTILHLAVQQNSCRVLHFLKENQKILNSLGILDMKNNWGETALHLAAGLGDVLSVSTLLELGSDQSIRDNWNRTAIDVALENGYINKLHMLDEIHRTKGNSSSLLLDSSLSNASRAEFIKSDDFKSTIQSRLRKTDTSQNCDNSVGSTASVIVHHIFNSTTETVSGSSSTSTTNVLTSSAAAVVHPPVKKVALSKLIEYPGDPNALSTYLTSNTADIHGRDMFGLTALHKVASWDKVDLLELLLLHNRDTVTVVDSIDVNCITNDANKYTALHMCVDSGAFNTLRRLLLDSRLDARIKDAKGRTALAFAVEKKYKAMTDLLLEYDAQS